MTRTSVNRTCTVLVLMLTAAVGKHATRVYDNPYTDTRTHTHIIVNAAFPHNAHRIKLYVKIIQVDLYKFLAANKMQLYSLACM